MMNRRRLLKYFCRGAEHPKPRHQSRRAILSELAGDRGLKRLFNRLLRVAPTGFKIMLGLTDRNKQKQLEL
jgi:hypothetical protein